MSSTETGEEEEVKVKVSLGSQEVRHQLQEMVTSNLTSRGISTKDLPETASTVKTWQWPASERERLERQRSNKRRWAQKERARSKALLERLKQNNESLERKNNELRREVNRLLQRKLQLRSLLIDHQCETSPPKRRLLEVVYVQASHNQHADIKDNDNVVTKNKQDGACSLESKHTSVTDAGKEADCSTEQLAAVTIVPTAHTTLVIGHGDAVDQNAISLSTPARASSRVSVSSKSDESSPAVVDSHIKPIANSQTLVSPQTVTNTQTQVNSQISVDSQTIRNSQSVVNPQTDTPSLVNSQTGGDSLTLVNPRLVKSQTVDNSRIIVNSQPLENVLGVKHSQRPVIPHTISSFSHSHTQAQTVHVPATSSQVPLHHFNSETHANISEMIYKTETNVDTTRSLVSVNEVHGQSVSSGGFSMTELVDSNQTFPPISPNDNENMIVKDLKSVSEERYHEIERNSHTDNRLQNGNYVDKILNNNKETHGAIPPPLALLQDSDKSVPGPNTSCDISHFTVTSDPTELILKTDNALDCRSKHSGDRKGVGERDTGVVLETSSGTSAKTPKQMTRKSVLMNRWFAQERNEELKRNKIRHQQTKKRARKIIVNPWAVDDSFETDQTSFSNDGLSQDSGPLDLRTNAVNSRRDTESATSIFSLSKSRTGTTSVSFNTNAHINNTDIMNYFRTGPEDRVADTHPRIGAASYAIASTYSSFANADGLTFMSTDTSKVIAGTLRSNATSFVIADTQVGRATEQYLISPTSGVTDRFERHTLADREPTTIATRSALVTQAEVHTMPSTMTMQTDSDKVSEVKTVEADPETPSIPDLIQEGHLLTRRQSWSIDISELPQSPVLRARPLSLPSSLSEVMCEGPEVNGLTSTTPLDSQDNDVDTEKAVDNSPPLPFLPSPQPAPDTTGSSEKTSLSNEEEFTHKTIPPNFIFGDLPSTPSTLSTPASPLPGYLIHSTGFTNKSQGFRPSKRNRRRADKKSEAKTRP